MTDRGAFRPTDESPGGTSFRGHIEFDYAGLIAAFGQPRQYTCDDRKVDVMWVLRADDGAIATILNWKDGPNYVGSGGRPVEQITLWHVGGHGPDIAARIARSIGLALSPTPGHLGFPLFS